MVLVERSHPAPKSLAIEARKQNGKYNKADVVERLRRDFHDKCYKAWKMPSWIKLIFTRNPEV
jgi:hypothetical protein